MNFMERLDGVMPMALGLYDIVDNANDTMQLVNKMMSEGESDTKAWRDACKQMRDAGDGYIRFGNQWRKIADYLEPTLDEMIEAGKEDIRDD